MFANPRRTEIRTNVFRVNNYMYVMYVYIVYNVWIGMYGCITLYDVVNWLIRVVWRKVCKL